MIRRVQNIGIWSISTPTGTQFGVRYNHVEKRKRVNSNTMPTSTIIIFDKSIESIDGPKNRRCFNYLAINVEFKMTMEFSVFFLHYFPFFVVARANSWCAQFYLTHYNKTYSQHSKWKRLRFNTYITCVFGMLCTAFTWSRSMLSRRNL